MTIAAIRPTSLPGPAIRLRLGIGEVRRAWPIRALLALAWMVVLPLLALALARPADVPATVLLATQALLPWLYLPAALVFATAAMLRVRTLALCALIPCLAGLTQLAPALGVSSGPPASAAAPATAAVVAKKEPEIRLRVFTANLLMSNAKTDGIAKEIRAARPDVVLLEEYTPTSAAGLERDGVLRQFRWSFLQQRRDSGGIGVWSRLPMRDLQVRLVRDRPMLVGQLLVHGTAVGFLGVHTVAPVTKTEAAAWSAQLDAAAAAARRMSGPLIVAGDFNATRGHAAFQALLSAGQLVDAHDRLGRGLATTWPNGHWYPPFLRPDHVLVRGLRPVAVREGVGAGSDHRPVVADLVLRG